MDTTNNVALPIFSRDGGFGLEQMGSYVLQRQGEDNSLIELKRFISLMQITPEEIFHSSSKSLYETYSHFENG